MRSPVSLSTGITYDRASIQRWLDSGNTTCPGTMLPLPSTDLVPNLTLRSIISRWAASCSPTSAAGSADSAGCTCMEKSPGWIVRTIASSGAELPAALHQLAAYLSDNDVDDFEKNALVGAGGAAETVTAVLRRKYDEETGVEAAVRVLAWIVASDGIDDASKKRVSAGLAADAAASARSLARVMRSGSGLEAWVDAARLAELLLANAADEASPELVAELVRLVGPVEEKGSLDGTAADAGLSYLAAIASSSPRRGEMVRLGAVPAAARALRSTESPGACAKALRVLESAAGCAEGRAALCERAEEAVPAVLDRMMKAGRSGRALGGVPPVPGPRVCDAAAAAEGGLTKLLLLMQSGCSPSARQMALDLLKIYKVNAKSCLASYDTKTTHIMPF